MRTVLVLGSSLWMGCVIEESKGDDTGGDVDSGSDACDDTADTGGWDTGDTGTEDLVTTITVEWSGDGDGQVDLIIENGDEGGYTFGMAETGSDQGWYGEDCIDDGGVFEYCHPATASGVSLDSVYDEVQAGEALADAIIDGSTTLMYQDAQDQITYVLTDSTGYCWAWGDDTSYYTDVGCDDISG